MKSIKLDAIYKSYLEKPPIPVFVQIILFYTAIVFSIFLLMAYITFNNVQQSLMEQNQRDLQATISNTLNYLNDYQKIDHTLLTKVPPRPYTTVQVLDDSGHILLDNVSDLQTDQYLKKLEDPQKIVDGQLIHTVSDHGTPVLIKNYHWQSNQGYIYTLRFSIITTQENTFLATLKSQFLLVNILGFILALGIGGLFAWRIMLPLKQIKQTLSSIDFNHLEKRVSIPPNRNELYNLAISVNNTLDRLQEGANQQKQFINDASHELRTPVTVIQGYTDLLMRWGKDDPETLEESIQAIHQETQYMKDLIEHLLFLARSSQGRLSINMDTVSIHDLLVSAYESNRMLIKDKYFSLGGTPAVFIEGDFNLLLQLLRIFLENSSKYTPSNGKVYLSGHVDTINNEVIITIKDNGIGIPKDQQQRIFERFYRVDESRTKDTGGTGLGLAIASQIVKIHNAYITVESEIDQGTSMLVHFPLTHKTILNKDKLNNDGEENSAKKASPKVQRIN